MKHGGTGLSDQGGVTFVEVLIVLAIISLMFTVSITLLQGYVGRESFRQSVQLFTTELGDVINDVRTDIWPEVNEIKCQNNSGTLDYTVDSTALPGRNKDCIFLGKAIQLGVGDSTLTPSVSEASPDYIEYTLVGLAAANDTRPEDFQVFRNEVPGDPALTFDTSRTRIVPHGGTITKVYHYGGSLPHPADHTDTNVVNATDFVYLDGFAIMLANFGEIKDNNTDDVLGGSRRISIWGIYLEGSTAPENDSTRDRITEQGFIAATKDHSMNVYYHEIKDRPIYICLDSGLGEKAFIKIGGSQGAITAVAEQGEAIKKTLCAS